MVNHFLLDIARDTDAFVLFHKTWSGEFFDNFTRKGSFTIDSCTASVVPHTGAFPASPRNFSVPSYCEEEICMLDGVGA